MTPLFKQNHRQGVTHYWNEKTPLERLNLVIKYMDFFWSLGLVTNSEMAVVESLSEGSREYIVQREEQPIFSSLNLKKNIKDQTHSKKLKAVLKTVFLKPEKQKEIIINPDPQLSLG